MTLLAALFAMVPPEHSANRALVAGKVIGGSAALILAGLVFYFRGRHLHTVAKPARHPES